MDEKIKLVAIDEYAETLGGISWEPMRAFGELELYDCQNRQEAARRIADADVVFTSNFPLDAGMIAASPRLRLVQVMGTGYNHVDVAAAAARGIAVCNVPDYSAVTVAQQTFALLLELCNRTGELSRGVRERGWKCADSGERVSYLRELYGKTFGMVGMGSIGRRVAPIAESFGMRVIYTAQRGPKPELPWEYMQSLDTLLAQSDIVSLHCPLNAQTGRMADRAFFAAMKPGAIFLNTGRGGLVAEEALAKALASGRLAGAGLDVTDPEPPRPDNPLLGLANCVISPHMGAATKEARQRLMDEAVKNVRAFFSGLPRYRVG